MALPQEVEDYINRKKQEYMEKNDLRDKNELQEHFENKSRDYYNKDVEQKDQETWNSINRW